MAEPSDYPIWDTNNTLSVQPPLSYRLNGWSAPGGEGEKPPLNYFNWWQNNVYLWTLWLNEKYLPSNVDKLLQNDTSATPGDAYIGSGYKDDQYYGYQAEGVQWYGREAVAAQYYGYQATFDQFYGQEAAAAQYYGLGALAAQYYGYQAGAVQYYGYQAADAQFYGYQAAAIQWYGREAAANQYYGYQATFDQFYGQEAVADQYYGLAALAAQYYGQGSQGPIEIGSTVGLASTKLLISGAKSATFEEIIDAAVSGWGPWVTPSYENGWVATATAGVKVLQYRQSPNGINLQISGSVDGTAATGPNVFTLPPGSRPTGAVYTTAVDGAVTGAKYIGITNAGALFIQGYAADAYSINCIIPIT